MRNSKRVFTKQITFDELIDETSLQLTEYISKLLSHWDVFKKVIAFSADNTTTFVVLLGKKKTMFST